MKSSLRGACLSGLVYPGVGQFVQKHYFRGIVLIGICTTSLLWVILAASRAVRAILARIESGSTIDDMSSILGEAAKFSGGGEDSAIGMSSVLIFMCWVIGIVDAYVSGKKIDAKNARKPALSPTDHACKGAAVQWEEAKAGSKAPPGGREQHGTDRIRV